MLPCLNHNLSSSIVLKSFLSSFTKISLSLIHKRHHPLRHYRCPLYVKAFSMNHLSMNRLSRSCSSSAALSVTATLPINERSIKSNKSRKKARLESSEMTLKRNLDLCSKSGDLVEALRLYDDAKSNGVWLSQPHYNNLLYLCSSYGCSSSGGIELDGGGGACDVELDLGSKWGFEIFRQMTGNKVAPNEATFTSMARLSARMEDPEMAFDLVKQMKEYGIVPKLRSYEPALHGFCKKREAEKAYEVDAHMTQDGVVVDESGLSALLKLSSDVKKADKVYEMLHRLRSTVRQVAESTALVMENWFKSEAAIEVGDENWDVVEVRDGFKKGGGGWHGQGWLGSGKWNVARTGMNEKGVCRSCGEKLVCIDIDPMETENFASSLANLACQKEVKADFKEFQEWLQQHGPFDAIVDGANVGLFHRKEFNFFQLISVVNKLHQMSSSKRLPLIILHKSRVSGGPARIANIKKVLESWKKLGVLYTAPAGSNDDWYWLYAAVSCKCLLVTNDEMRDHLFQLLGTSFFSRWKEKHQVRLTFSGNRPHLHMPPPYSIVTQESETGSWHAPTVMGDDIETPRQWVCATRARAGTEAKTRAGAESKTQAGAGVKSIYSLFRE